MRKNKFHILWDVTISRKLTFDTDLLNKTRLGCEGHMSWRQNTGRSHLVFVLDDVGVDLVQGRHAVELVGVQARLLSQVGTHVLVADGRHPGDVRVVPGRIEATGFRGGSAGRTRGAAARATGAVTYLSTQFL